MNEDIIDTLKENLRKLLEKINLSDYFQIIYNEIKQHFKNIIFLSTALLFFFRIVFLLYDEGFSLWYNINCKYSSYFDKVTINIINFFVIITFVVSFNAYLRYCLSKSSNTSSNTSSNIFSKIFLKLKALVPFALIMILITSVILALSMFSVASFSNINFKFNTTNIRNFIIITIVLSFVVSLFFLYPFSYIIFPSNNANIENNAKKKKLWMILFIGSLAFILPFVGGVINASRKKDFHVVVEKAHIFAIIYENNDSYIIEPINDDGIINTSIQKEISKEGITIYSLNNINNSKERDNIIKESARYN